MKKHFVCLFLLFFFSCSICFAQNQTNNATKDQVQNGEVATAAEVEQLDYQQQAWDSTAQPLTANNASNIGRKVLNTIKNIFFFVIVVAILFFLFVLLKKLNGNSLPSGDLIEVITTKQLSSNRYLHIVKLGKEYYLISATDNQISLLRNIEDKQLLDELAIYKEKNAEAKKDNFTDHLKDFMNSSKSFASISEKAKKTAQNIKNRRNNLKKM